MRVLIVASANSGNLPPFVVEQAESLEKLGVKIDFFGIVGKGIKGYLSNRKRLLKKIESFEPDILHAHYGLSGALAVLQRKVPVVITFHNGETLPGHKAANFISSIAALLSKHTIYVAQHIYDLSFFKPLKSYSIIPCAVDLDDCKIYDQLEARKELGFSDEKKYILFGGAFSNLRKNYALLKDALEILDRDDIEVIEMKNLNRGEVTKLLCACDLFALPTKSEGSPQALKEAMACNCPIIATDVADIKTLLGKVSGHYLCSFNPKEVVALISEALVFKGRTNGRERILSLGLDSPTVAEKILFIYNSVLKSNNN